MLKFFRNIRQNLLSEGKTGKYLKYAVGEIVLVVIGILLALQVNNWNEQRKERLLEVELRNGIAKNLQSNVVLLENKIKFMNFVNSSADIILNLKGEMKVYNDTLDKHIFSSMSLVANFYFPNQGFEALKAQGVRIIEDETLRSEIVILFDETYPLTAIRFEEMKSRYDIQQYLDENFWAGNIKLHPLDPNKTFSDPYFFSLVNSLKNSRSWLIFYLEENLKETLRVLELFKEYI